MHVRLTTITGAKNIDAGLEFVKTDAIPRLRQQKGYRGISVSGNRSAGVMNVLSLWDSEADLDASESAIEKVRSEAVDLTGGQMKVERFEQLVYEVKTPPTPGAKLHIREIKMDPAKIDENVEFFNQTIVPEFKNSAGFVAVRNLMNRKTGEGKVGTVWADDASLQAQLAQTDQRRSRAADRGVTFGEDRVAEILFTAAD
jgi:heme-degrading monooxygenase HmoA